MKKKNIILTLMIVISLAFVLLQIPIMIDLFDNIEYAIFTYETYGGEISLSEIPLFTKSLTRVIFLIFLIVSFIASISYIVYNQFKHSNASNFVRYTYEEYKEYREQKKAEKQANKQAKMLKQKENLEKQLQEMGKTE